MSTKLLRQPAASAAAGGLDGARGRVGDSVGLEQGVDMDAMEEEGAAWSQMGDG